ATVHLLDNACRFSPKFGSVVIRGYPLFWERRLASSPAPPLSGERRRETLRQANAYRVDILDSGPPIPAAYRERAFEGYAPCSGGEDRSGGGLGLACCRMILAQHQGWVWAEDDPGGTLFCFVLPFHWQAQPADTWSREARTSGTLI